MMNSVKQNVGKALAATGAALAAGSASATSTFDISGITSASDDVKLIGGAVFLVMIAIAVFKWGKRVL